MTIPLGLVVPWQKEHYFAPQADPPRFTRRAFDFRGDLVLMPLVHAFLRSCAADRDDDYRYVFDLLGTELAVNAIRHSRSGGPGGTYTLRVDRSTEGLKLTCRDDGVEDGSIPPSRELDHLSAPSPDACLFAESRRGLGLVDALATSWGDNGRPGYRHVWFFLAYDLADSAWPGL
ncbi:ATP-binding protein [Nocardiopsis sediminis]|uniref:ATP-binding protein n=1 Tax=Nocardiopsis sediminis TaxID=1778267 RepID=A0ABV8FQ42_9ACTN